jgi:starch synthase (maltosyl-transferring)
MPMDRRFADLFQSSSPPSPILIEDLRPVVDCGRYPVKREVGDRLVVSADIFREGHDGIAAVLQFRTVAAETWSEVEMSFVDNDRWEGQFDLTENTTYLYRIEAFPDVFSSWRDEITKKFDADVDLASEMIEGARILEEARPRVVTSHHAAFDDVIDKVKSEDRATAVEAVNDPRFLEIFREVRSRADLVHSQELRVTVDRVRARFSAWYSLFARSAGSIEGQSATFRDVIDQLPRISGMGFDTLYLLPIHPIGTTHRKGRNNTLNAEPGDPGVPYGIGSEEGGHDAIHPDLGTIEDFRALIAACDAIGMDVALDVAVQASPDHPWTKEHPEWFNIRPDGTIKYAENPPKKYQDIYPINFQNTDWQGLWLELKRIILYWVENGVRAFRVDNPHTKPTIFWEWLIFEVQREHPDVIFLSEAFTRPKVMKTLAKAGFTQSYSYFTWRNFKQEMTEYLVDLTQGPEQEYMRANFFPNTHDILPYILQEGGRPAFMSRFVLAATLSSVYGIYSGFELCENTAVPGREEYLNSEKYEYKVWDWDRPGNISGLIARVNQIRRQHPALQEYNNLEFYDSSSDSIIAYGKRTPGNDNIVVVIVNMDPFSAHETWLDVPIERFGLDTAVPFRVTELLTGETFMWQGSRHHWRLDPQSNPVAIFSLSPFQQQAFGEPCG